MVFGKLLAGLTAGGATLDTVLDTPDVRPGGALVGTVHLVGGDTAVEVRGLEVALAARAEVEGADSEWTAGVPFSRQRLAGAFVLDPGDRHALPFSLPVPWESPVTTYRGWHLRGMSIGLRTDVDIARSVDRSDLDPVAIHPLPAQERVLAALETLGFRFVHADCEVGHIPGSTMPFYQEIELAPPARYARGINQLEVTFLTRADSMDVILEADRRGGLLTEGRDVLSRLRLDVASLESTDVRALLDAEVGRLAARRGWL